MLSDFTTREQIIETVNRLFVFTDNREWTKLTNEVFTEQVLFDMSSLGAGEPATMHAKQICENWQKGFEGIDAVHHQAGNYLVTISGKSATVDAYAIAIHYKKAAARGNTREFVGNYQFGLEVTDKGWRIHTFRYFLKYATGNTELL